jgi:hypothetical protein
MWHASHPTYNLKKAQLICTINNNGVSSPVFGVFSWIRKFQTIGNGGGKYRLVNYWNHFMNQVLLTIIHSLCNEDEEDDMRNTDEDEFSGGTMYIPFRENDPTSLILPNIFESSDIVNMDNSQEDLIHKMIPVDLSLFSHISF